MERLSNGTIGLQLVAEGLVKIRLLARDPITADSQKAIHDLADALHNIPRIMAGPDEEQAALAFLLDAGLTHTREVYQRNQWTSEWIDVKG